VVSRHSLLCKIQELIAAPDMPDVVEVHSSFAIPKCVKWNLIELLVLHSFSIDILRNYQRLHIYPPKATDHTFQKYCIFIEGINYTFSSMETMETRGEPADNWYFAKGPYCTSGFGLRCKIATQHWQESIFIININNK
jgi:hypothetical protein